MCSPPTDLTALAVDQASATDTATSSPLLLAPQLSTLSSSEITRIADLYTKISPSKTRINPPQPSDRDSLLNTTYTAALALLTRLPYVPPFPSLIFIALLLVSVVSAKSCSRGLAMKRGKSKADAPKKADSKLAVKKGSERASKKPRNTKAEKDPNKPKRPPSAFFVFMEEFRKTFKEKHPNNKSVAVDKAPYVTKAAKLKAEYTKKIATYNKNEAQGGSRPAAIAEEDESDKSKSEVHDDDEDAEGSEEEEDDE
ncbi:hypothetical protein ZIOFF_021253 [Zingiber officinale]|uniref:HMG box domain-containing protein n=1 Tax=Zingiber officinale TaxID=94328 RepID=A0A8J5H1J4_ZINOF|nr:hypothetical protein ZIOFF_021253 [Zingiber officinale]